MPRIAVPSNQPRQIYVTITDYNLFLRVHISQLETLTKDQILIGCNNFVITSDENLDMIRTLKAITLLFNFEKL